MPRKFSTIAPDWWDYTTLDTELIEEAARLTPAQMARLSRDGFRVVFYDTLEDFYLAEALEYITAWRQATADNPVIICGPIEPTEQLPLVARLVNELGLSLRHEHFWGMDEWYADGAEVPTSLDVVVAPRFAADAPATVKDSADVDADDMILDIGPRTARMLADRLAAAGTIVWNGPVGVFEFEAFSHGTQAIARAIAQSSAFSIAGGGDTLAAIAKYGIEKDVGYISTGGGAFLEVLEGKTLPAFEILEKRALGV